MFSIGTDIIRITRIGKSIQSSHFLEGVFTKKEREYCKSAESFAGIFAAKETYFKACKTGINARLNTVEILHREDGSPYLNGISNSDVSISHDGDYAIATVIIWE